MRLPKGAAARAGWILAALLIVWVLYGCGSKERPARTETTEPAKPKVEWFWYERLSHRPEALPALPVDPSWPGRVAQAMEGLKGKTPPEAEETVQSLVGLGEGVIPLIAPYFKDPDRTRRWAAVLVLGRLGSPRSLEPLLEFAYRDEWDAVAVMAAEYVHQLAEPWILPRIIKALGPYPVDYNPHPMVRVRAAETMLSLGDFSGVPFLISILKGNTPAEPADRLWDWTPRLAWEKEEALAILSRLAGSDFGFRVDAPLNSQADAARRFEEWWRTESAGRWRTAPALNDPMLQQEIRTIVDGLSSYQARNADGARYCLRMLGPPVIPFLVEAIRSGGFYQRFHSLDILAELAPAAPRAAREAARPVADALNDPSPAVRMKAARTLGFLHEPDMLPRLKGALSDKDPDVRLCAVQAMGRIGGTDAEQILLSVAQGNSDGQMEAEAKAALVRISPRFDPMFLDLFRSDDLKRQSFAVQKLMDLLGDDCGFTIGSPPDQREAATARIAKALAALPRDGG